MAELHQLKRLILSQYRQYRFCEVDLTDSATGGIIPDLCLIGPNGSGKSTLLAELYQALNPTSRPLTVPAGDLADSLVLAKYATDGEDLYLARSPMTAPGEALVFSVAIEKSEGWDSLSKNPLTITQFRDQFADHLLEEASPTMLPGKATAWFSPYFSSVDNEPSCDFDAFIEKGVREREGDFHRFLTEPENREKTVGELEREFESLSPNFLSALNKIWSAILKPSSIHFASGNGNGPIPFSSLSPGLQSLLLRIGHVYSQYFGCEHREGCLFLDGPEESLHPEIAQSVMNFYRSILITQKSQLFVATHSPLIAALFPPERRLRLKLGNDGAVIVSNGIAPMGADPNQILKSDFEIGNLQFQAKAVSSGRYSQLKRAIQASDDQDELADLIDEVMTIRKF